MRSYATSYLQIVSGQNFFLRECVLTLDVLFALKSFANVPRSVYYFYKIFVSEKKSQGLGAFWNLPVSAQKNKKILIILQFF
jgi:hypothetical protein